MKPVRIIIGIIIVLAIILFARAAYTYAIDSPHRISSEKAKQLIQAGKFDVHLDHRGLEPSVNRLVLGMLTSALILGSSVLLSREVAPLLFPNESFFGLYRLSILGLAGCSLSILLGLRLIRAINKSGHLDSRK